MPANGRKLDKWEEMNDELLLTTRTEGDRSASIVCTTNSVSSRSACAFFNPQERRSLRRTVQHSGVKGITRLREGVRWEEPFRHQTREWQTSLAFRGRSWRRVVYTERKEHTTQLAKSPSGVSPDGVHRRRRSRSRVETVANYIYVCNAWWWVHIENKKACGLVRRFARLLKTIQKGLLFFLYLPFCGDQITGRERERVRVRLWWMHRTLINLHILFTNRGWRQVKKYNNERISRENTNTNEKREYR